MTIGIHGNSTTITYLGRRFELRQCGSLYGINYWSCLKVLRGGERGRSMDWSRVDASYIHMMKINCCIRSKVMHCLTEYQLHVDVMSFCPQKVLTGYYRLYRGLPEMLTWQIQKTIMVHAHTCV